MAPQDDLRIFYRLLGMEGPLSRVDLSRRLDLSRSRVTRVCDQMLEKGLICETGERVVSGGRQASLLALRGDSHGILSGEIGLEGNGEIALYRGDLKPLWRRKLPQKGQLSPEAWADLFVSEWHELQKQNPAAPRPWGLGLGVSGLVSCEKGTVAYTHAFPHWGETPLARLLEERLGFPVFLDNDINLATLGEHWAGSGRGRRHFLFIQVGPGLRMGMILDGRLYRGARGLAGELGHCAFSEEDSPLCYCGNAACLEAVISPERLLRMAHTAPFPTSRSRVWQSDGQGGETLSLEGIYAAVGEEDPFALALLRRQLQPLGRAVGNMVNLFDPEVILIGGLLLKAGPKGLEEIRQGLESQRLPLRQEGMKVEASRLGDEAVLTGGAVLVQEAFCRGKLEPL